MADSQFMDVEENGVQQEQEHDMIVEEDPNATVEQVEQAAAKDEPLEPMEHDKQELDENTEGDQEQEETTEEKLEQNGKDEEDSEEAVTATPQKQKRAKKSEELPKRESYGRAAKRAEVEKEPVKKAPAKKEPAKKEPAKKAPVQKEPVKKAPAPKEPVKKAPVQKEPVKKAPVQKEPAKKAPVQKEPAKKASHGRKRKEPSDDIEAPEEDQVVSTQETLQEDEPREPSSELEASQPKAKKGRKSKANTTREINESNRSVKNPPKHFHTYEEFAPNIPADRVLTCGEGEQLGHPGRTTTRKPRAVDTLPEGTKILQVEAGGVHTTILTTDHKVYACGINEGGTCPVKGLAAEETTDNLTVIEFTEEIQKEGKIIQFTSGAGFTAALTDRGSVIAWGNLRDENGSYELHALFGNMRKGPTVILHHGDVVIVKIDAGENHLVMLSNQGEIYTFGEGSHGQLGNTTRMGSIRSKYVADNTGKSLRRTVLEKGKMVKFTDVFAGGYWTMGRAEDGRIFVCGLNNFGQLGLPLPEDMKENEDNEEQNKKLIVPLLTPSPAFSADKKWTHIAGVKHVIARNSEGEVYGIGLNTDNELGIGTYTGKGDEEHWRYFELQKIEFADDVKIAGITATLGASIAWTEDGRAFSFGFDSVGQLGLGITEEDEKSVKTPALVKSAHLEGYKIISVSIADNHSIFLAVEEE
ncbi:hypothetical protein FO519_000036 [Halicephalobus sp. NKZ332]|nr:hypothetical protein FO519_000036 [Halicephalobus sp. NKZ332]